MLMYGGWILLSMYCTLNALYNWYQLLRKNNVIYLYFSFLPTYYIVISCLNLFYVPGCSHQTLNPYVVTRAGRAVNTSAISNRLEFYSKWTSAPYSPLIITTSKLWKYNCFHMFFQISDELHWNFIVEISYSFLTYAKTTRGTLFKYH